MKTGRNDKKTALETVLTALKNMKDWMIGQSVNIMAVAYIVLPDGRVLDWSLNITSRESRNREGRLLQLACLHIGARSVVTIDIQWAVDKDVDQNNFLADLGRYGRINSIPGYQEMLVVSYALPDGEGPAVVCNVVRNENLIITGYGNTYRVDEKVHRFVLPWNNHIEMDTVLEYEAKMRLTSIMSKDDMGLRN